MFSLKICRVDVGGDIITYGGGGGGGGGSSGGHEAGGGASSRVRGCRSGDANPTSATTIVVTQLTSAATVVAIATLRNTEISDKSEGDGATEERTTSAPASLACVQGFRTCDAARENFLRQRQQ